MKFLFAVLVFAFLGATASADSVWNYTGNPINGTGWVDQRQSCNCSLDGTVTFNSSWQAVAWDFTDGGVTLTNVNSTAIELTPFDPILHSTTPFQTWDVLLDGQGYLFGTELAGGVQDGDSITALTGAGIVGIEQGHPGVWSEVVATPEPGTLLLLTVGLLLIVCKKAVAA